jgi:predicted membrane protein
MSTPTDASSAIVASELLRPLAYLPQPDRAFELLTFRYETRQHLTCDTG